MEEDIGNENFHQQILWNHSLIQYKQKVLFFPDWKRHGVKNEFLDILITTLINELIKCNNDKLNVCN